jgi:hypothetical protein
MNDSSTAKPFLIPVAVEVPPALAAASGRSPGVLAAVEAQFRLRLRALGMVGTPELRLYPGKPTRALRVRVRERLQPFSPQLMQRVWLAVAPDRAEVPQWRAQLPRDGFSDRWFTKFIEDLTTAGPTDADWDLALRFTGNLAMEVAFQRPGCLLGRDQVVSLAGEVENRQGLSPEDLHEVLGELLAVGLLPSASAVAEALADGKRHDTPLRDTIEALAAASRPDRVEIQVSPREFEALAPGAVDEHSLPLYQDPVVKSARSAFEQMEQDLFAALGLRVPALFLRRVDDLPAGVLRLSVNNLVTPPVPFSPPLAKAVLEELRRQAGRLLGIEDVEFMLARLDQVFPELVSAALDRMPLGELTRVLRALLEERVTIRDLRAILERLVQYDTVPADANRYLILDDRLPVPLDPPSRPPTLWHRYLAFVRSGSGLRNYLTHKYRQEGLMASRVRAIRLTPEIEGRVQAVAANGGRSDAGSAWEETQAAILAAVWEECSRLPAGAAPVLLVRDPLTRRVVWDLIEGELPDVPVMALAELRQGVEVVPAGSPPSGADTLPQDLQPRRRVRRAVRRLPAVRHDAGSKS